MRMTKTRVKDGEDDVDFGKIPSMIWSQVKYSLNLFNKSL